jgi:hypothetical protein
MVPARLAPAALLFGVGVLMGLSLAGRLTSASRLLGAAPASTAPNVAVADLASLKADVETLKQKATDQAHVMVSVAHHFTNLWFAGQHANWPLAQFYWNETRSHLRWAVRVIPVRKDDSGQDIDLQAILQALENSPLKALEDAITSQDRDLFVKAYRFTLESCYACHKAADKPFLTLQIPTAPADSLVNFDPAASSLQTIGDADEK